MTGTGWLLQAYALYLTRVVLLCFDVQTGPCPQPASWCARVREVRGEGRCDLFSGEGPPVC